MKITEASNNEKTFQPISVTFTFENEYEVIAMWHFLNASIADRINFFSNTTIKKDISESLAKAKTDDNWKVFNNIVVKNSIKIIY